MARQPGSPWNHTMRSMLRSPDAPLKDFKLEIDGVEVDVDTYNAHHKAKALAARELMRGRK